MAFTFPTPFRTRRSAGIPVTAAVHGVLRRANAARDRRDWAEAAGGYKAALAADPGLAHIWIQLGNMLKEAGDGPGALDAYEEAARLRPGDAEPLLQAGHLHRAEGRHGDAGLFFLRAFEAEPDRGDSAAGLHHALLRARGPARERLFAALGASIASQAPAEPAAALPRDGALAAVFDISDLIYFWSHNRLPTGIQRVEIQLIQHVLRRAAPPAALCCFIDGRDEWLELGPEQFRRIVALSLAGGSRDDPAWVAAMHALHARLAVTGAFAFPPGAVLVNLGPSWDFHNYFLLVRDAKRRFGVRYVPLVYDLIPALVPGSFTREARRHFVPWVPGVLTHADAVLTISQATGRDLVRTAAALDIPFDPAHLTVMPLDADFRPGIEPLPEAALDAWRLRPGSFVLLVSTVEPRKGHDTALDAWSLLIARHGAEAVPTLVCVGKRGWLSEPVYARLDADSTLSGRVRMLEGVGDPGLALLYRTCLFTVYPSRYEGWGLPVTEALCYGKPVITTDSSSLPEAGGPFAVYVPPGNAAALADAAERMAFDTVWRTAAEQRIRAGFRPRGWDDLAAQVVTALAALASRAASPVLPAPLATLGAFHSLARPDMLRLWPGAITAEAFRTGTGWAAPNAAGTRLRPGGGTLSIGVPPGAGPLHLAVLLLGPRQGAARWRVAVECGTEPDPVRQGRVGQGARAWATLACPPATELRLHLFAEPVPPPDDEREGGLPPVEPDEQDAAPVLVGFFVCEAADLEARMRLVEAATLGNLDDLNPYREPDPTGTLGGDGEP